MKDISKAGYGLLCFVDAVLQYCVVFKEVKPKQDKLKELEKDHELVRSNLQFSIVVIQRAQNQKVLSQNIKLYSRAIICIGQYVMLSSFIMNIKSKN